MACCIVGSILLTLIVGLTRWVKQEVLGQTCEQPELWRLSDVDL